MKKTPKTCPQNAPIGAKLGKYGKGPKMTKTPNQSEKSRKGLIGTNPTK